MAATLASFDEDQWAHPSRCEGWSARDVIVHLESTNTFWAFSVAQGLAGKPTEFLATFDPVSSPAELVAAAGDLSGAEVYERFAASTEALADLLGGLDDEQCLIAAESPPGHVSITALAHHALWDSWIHERDILLPLGIDQEVEADEVAASLRYVAALAPAFAVNNGTAKRGVLGITVTDPALSIVVDVGDHVSIGAGPATTAPDFEVIGDAVELLEALSIRRPLGIDLPPEHAWLLSGLAETFDVAP